MFETRYLLLLKNYLSIKILFNEYYNYFKTVILFFNNKWLEIRRFMEIKISKIIAQ